jgi:hypothetical protein
MGNKIELELTELEFNALTSVVSSASAMLEECLISQKEIKAIDRMLKKNGYKRNFN